MNLANKILLGLVLVAGGAFVYMSVRTLATKKAWGDLANQRKERIARLDQQAAQLREDLAVRKRELREAVLGWDRVWPEVQVTDLNPQTGQAALAFGTEPGLTPEQLVYAFRSVEEGAVYLGEFQVNQAEAERVVVSPTEALSPEKLQMLQADSWRLRSVLPVGYKVRLEDRNQYLAVKQDELNQAVANMRTWQRTAEEAAQQQRFREEEVGQLYQDLAQRENDRDQALAEQLRLAAELADTLSRRDHLLKQNKQLAARLDELERRALASPSQEANR